MNLLDMISQRGDIASKHMPQPATTHPARGQQPWQSGFEGNNQAMLQELMKLFQQRGQINQAMATRHQQVPVAQARTR